eukprot:GILI01007870.1.p1 GENE.GILI01007870.1~~GILI01007870.1.p1  ORF type:complete len:573 (-),score=176.19 GILI01007870.1:204-1922(-)
MTTPRLALTCALLLLLGVAVHANLFSEQSLRKPGDASPKTESKTVAVTPSSPKKEEAKAQGRQCRLFVIARTGDQTGAETTDQVYLNFEGSHATPSFNWFPLNRENQQGARVGEIIHSYVTFFSPSDKCLPSKLNLMVDGNDKWFVDWVLIQDQSDEKKEIAASKPLIAPSAFFPLEQWVTGDDDDSANAEAAPAAPAPAASSSSSSSTFLPPKNATQQEETISAPTKTASGSRKAKADHYSFEFGDESRERLRKNTFRLLYCVGWAVHNEPPEGYITPITAQNARIFLQRFAELYPDRHCDGMKSVFLEFVKNTPNVLHGDNKAREYVSKILHALTCEGADQLSTNTTSKSWVNLGGSFFPRRSLTLVPFASCPYNFSPNVTSNCATPTFVYDDLFEFKPYLCPTQIVGPATWGLLHAISASLQDEDEVAKFREMLTAFIAGIYPCEGCRTHFQTIWHRGEGEGLGRVESLKRLMPVESIKNREDAMIWLWRAHNVVSMRLFHNHINEDSLEAAQWTAKTLWIPPSAGPACEPVPQFKCLEKVNEHKVARAVSRRYRLRPYCPNTMYGDCT